MYVHEHTYSTCTYTYLPGKVPGQEVDWRFGGMEGNSPLLRVVPVGYVDAFCPIHLLVRETSESAK